VNEWSRVFLGVIAGATALMAIVQIGAIVVLARVALQVQGILSIMQKDIRPLIARANAIAEEASKTATLATAQAQKIDKLVTDLTRRVDETSAVIQEAIVTPAREGMAIIAALKAGFGALKGFRDLRGRPGGVDDEDALFIG
jgi:hypothetical protein